MSHDVYRRLYLIVSTSAADPSRLSAFATALAAGDVACVRIATHQVARAEVEAAAKTLAPYCAQTGAALLLEEDFALAAKLRLDGVHLRGATKYAEARKTLGEEGVVGVGCGVSRHEAMVAAERGADYVSFASGAEPLDPDTVDWWQTFMEVPCVVEPGPEEDARIFAEPADFLALDAQTLAAADPAGVVGAAQAMIDAMPPREQ